MNITSSKPAAIKALAEVGRTTGTAGAIIRHTFAECDTSGVPHEVTVLILATRLAQQLNATEQVLNGIQGSVGAIVAPESGREIDTQEVPRRLRLPR